MTEWIPDEQTDANYLSDVPDWLAHRFDLTDWPSDTPTLLTNWYQHTDHLAEQLDLTNWLLKAWLTNLTTELKDRLTNWPIWMTDGHDLILTDWSIYRSGLAPHRQSEHTDKLTDLTWLYESWPTDKPEWQTDRTDWLPDRLDCLTNLTDWMTTPTHWLTIGLTEWPDWLTDRPTELTDITK